MKIDRLFAIAMFFLYKRTTTVGELSRHFEVSERTIYRDLAALECAGLPLDSSVGRGGGVGLMPGFRWEEKLLSPQWLGLLSDTLEGLSAILPGHFADGSSVQRIAGRDDERMVKLEIFNPRDEHQNLILSTVAAAIEDSVCVCIDYADANGNPSTRSVEPLRLVLAGSAWYLQAWCRLRSQYRVFRLRRIVNVAREEAKFDRSSRLSAMPEFELEAENSTQQPVRLWIPDANPAILAWLGNRIPAGDHGVMVDLPWPIDVWLETWLAGHAADVYVVEPLSLREAVRARLQNGIDLYDNPDTPLSKA